MKRGVLYATGFLVLINVALLIAFLFRTPERVASRGTGAGEDAAAGQRGVYAVTGVVSALRPDGSNVVIRHEAIPGFMAAMTMTFRARDTREVARLQPGDRVTFRLLVTDDESWIDGVERIGVAEAAPAFEYEHSRVVRDVEPLELGDPMPDYVFTNQFRQPVRLGDYRGSAVGLTFVFTRCPLPDFCPRMLKNLAAAEAAMRADASGPTNWHLISMTIDPAFDTPEVLRAQAESYRYDPRRWTFLTGALIDIDSLTEQVGLVFRRQTPDALPDHNLRTLVIDPEGRLARVIVGNTWTPEELAADLRAAALGLPVGASP